MNQATRTDAIKKAQRLVTAINLNLGEPGLAMSEESPDAKEWIVQMKKNTGADLRLLRMMWSVKQSQGQQGPPKLIGSDLQDYWRTVRAIESIVRCHVTDEPFRQEDVALVNSALSTPLEATRICAITHRGRTVQYLEPQYTATLRSVAQYLLAYLDAFRNTPELAVSKPAGICASCQKLYARTKAHQQYCSMLCREHSWRASKLAEDPDYYARNARQVRQAKKKQAEAQAEKARREKKKPATRPRRKVKVK